MKRTVKMKKETNRKEPDINLFISKIKHVPLEEPYSSLFKRDRKLQKKIYEEEKHNRIVISEAKLLITSALLKTMNLTDEDINKIKAKKKRITNTLLNSFGPLPKKIKINTNYINPLCREVTYYECQHKVCVDNPVPLDIHHAEYDSDGEFIWYRNYDQFGLYDYVKGREVRFGKDITNRKDGEIWFNSAFKLNTQGKVRRIGILCAPITSGTGSAVYNTYYYAQGDYEWPDDDWGQVELWCSFIVRSKVPNGNWVSHVPYSDSENKYCDITIYNGTCGPAPNIPPHRFVNLNQIFPTNTEFMIDYSLRYRVSGCGDEGGGYVRYYLQVNPYINLESCTWEW